MKDSKLTAAFGVLFDQLYRHRCRIEILRAIEDDNVNAKHIRDVHNYSCRYICASLYRDAAVGIMRIYDKPTTGQFRNLCLRYCLQACQDDRPLTAATVDELQADLAQVAPTINRLRFARHKLFAHNDLETYLGATREAAPSAADLAAICEHGREWLSALSRAIGGGGYGWALLDASGFVRDLAAGNRLRCDKEVAVREGERGDAEGAESRGGESRER